MKYSSTRDKSVKISAKPAILQGISADGGLFVPETLPKITQNELELMRNSDYAFRAEFILSKFLTDYSTEELHDCIQKAYKSGKFSDEENIAPIVNVDNFNYVLELWHGPTCAFKDMALQILPHFMSKASESIGNGQNIVILTATSGDTGKAALEGFKDVEGTKIIVFYPREGVSEIQKLQMVSQEGTNVGVCSIEGNFDDAQTSVKKLFTDKEANNRLLKNNMRFSSANSINWGRLAPQIVYYFTAYLELMETGEIDYAGEKINICVPTGNFGNILAAYYAMEMGLPVNKLICASNMNNILTDFINTGVYNRNRNFYTTISPSMDILISSNLERLIYQMSGGNDETVRGWMNDLSEKGRYEVNDTMKSMLNNVFFAGFCGEEDTKKAIKNLFDTQGYLCDTHTAVAVEVLRQYREKTGDISTPSIIVSTASPYKFPKSVLSALTGELNSDNEFMMANELSVVSTMPIPSQLAELDGKTVRFDGVCTDETLKDTVMKMLGI